MHAIKILSCMLLVGSLVPRPARAQTAPDTTRVVLAPLASIGGDKIKGVKRLATLIQEGLATLPKLAVIDPDTASAATRKAKQPKLRACDGDASCLADLGKLTAANIVVYAEVSDLGDAQVIYLKAVDVAAGKELRSTTLELGGDRAHRQQASKAAATQLLAPNLYVGTLKVESPVKGATIFLDGHSIATTPAQPVAVYVGSHALRVTHPEHNDYVRFVDVRFGEETAVKAELLGLPGLNRKLSAKGVLEGESVVGNQIIEHRERPWYYRWYTITGGITVIAVTSAILASGSSSIDADLIRDL